MSTDIASNINYLGSGAFASAQDSSPEAALISKADDPKMMIGACGAESMSTNEAFSPSCSRAWKYASIVSTYSVQIECPSFIREYFPDRDIYNYV